MLKKKSDWEVLELVHSKTVRDEDPGKRAAVYEYMYEILKAIRVDGKKLPVDAISPSGIQKAIELTGEEDGETIDLMPRIQAGISTFRSSPPRPMQRIAIRSSYRHDASTHLPAHIRGRVGDQIQMH